MQPSIPGNCHGKQKAIVQKQPGSLFTHTGSVVFQTALREVFGAKADTVKNVVNHLA